MIGVLRRLFPGKTDVRECSECGQRIDAEGCRECKGYVVKVTYPGYAGGRYEQPEPAEGVIWCPQCQEEVDAWFDWTGAECFAHHEVEIPEPDEEPDYDDRWDR